ncbi:MAG: cyclic nucleotide-binding domain-containing protein [Magnetococcales bacterium]|nr:cyclic nucleotide-binding domain-containing protein [Magnetococcales bacterium]
MIGYMAQDVFLFNLSIRDNIRLGNLRATDEEVQDAARSAMIHDDIMALPDGYGTVIGEGGTGLSGGQAQRVALARSFLQRPDVLILDEATSKLDSVVEREIDENISRFRQGRIVILVTHHLRSVVDADKIFVFDRGEIVEQGDHGTLMNQGGVYANLFNQQVPVVYDDHVPMVNVGWFLQLPFLADVPGHLLRTIVSQFGTESFRGGEYIFREGDPATKFFIIVTGRVEVIRRDRRTGEERVVGTMRDSDYFGEIGIRYQVSRTASIRAAEPTQCLVLGESVFRELFSRSSSMQKTARRRWENFPGIDGSCGSCGS